jgi:hypothetical protein
MFLRVHNSSTTEAKDNKMIQIVEMLEKKFRSPVLKMIKRRFKQIEKNVVRMSIQDIDKKDNMDEKFRKETEILKKRKQTKMNCWKLKTQEIK